MYYFDFCLPKHWVFLDYKSCMGFCKKYMYFRYATCSLLYAHENQKQQNAEDMRIFNLTILQFSEVFKVYLSNFSP